MRKFYLLFAAMFAYSVVATAGIKNLFKQDFETVSTPADAGWTSPNLAGGMKIVSTEEGGWFEFELGNNNNRNAVMNWNPAEGTIFDGQDVKKYTDDEPMDVENFKCKGGGGTSFKPPFKWLREHGEEDINCLVYFTDGYGDAPTYPPPYPTLWVLTSDGAEDFCDWGEKMKFKPDYRENN